MKPGALFIASIFISLLVYAFSAIDVWVGVDVIAGHDLSFREVAGFGIILGVASGATGRITESLNR